MWHLLDSFGRPPLGRHLSHQALALNEAALRQARRPPQERDGLVLAELLSAGSACWAVLRGRVDVARRSLLQDNLRRQRRLCERLLRTPLQHRVLDVLAACAQSPAEARALQHLQRRSAPGDAGRAGRAALEALLHQQAAWLHELDAAALPSEAELQDALARVYRKARKAVARDWRSARARRRLGDLVHAEELLLRAAGHTSQRSRAARQRLYRLLLEEATLRRLRHATGGRSGGAAKRALRCCVERRRAQLAVEVKRCRSSGFRQGAGRYRAALAWQVFQALIAAPLPFAAAPPGERGGKE